MIQAKFMLYHQCHKPGTSLQQVSLRQGVIRVIMHDHLQVGARRLPWPCPDRHSCLLQRWQRHSPQLHAPAHLPLWLAMVPAHLLCHGLALGGKACTRAASLPHACQADPTCVNLPHRGPSSEGGRGTSQMCAKLQGCVYQVHMLVTMLDGKPQYNTCLGIDASAVNPR